MVADVITSAPGIIVRPPLADATLTVDGGTAAISATVVVANKGWPFKIHTVNKQRIEPVFGKPLHSSKSDSEGLRHMHDAAKECLYIRGVRVTAADAAYPVVQLDKTPANPAVTSALTFDTEVVLGAANWIAFYPIDGETSANRRVSISNVDLTANRFDLEFQEEVAVGVWQAIPNESYTVGLGFDDVDDMGAPAYVESVLKDGSARFNCVVAPDATMSMVSTAQVAFVGGTNGGVPTTADWIKAWDMFRNEDVEFDNAFMAGNYGTTVIANAENACKTRLGQFFYDIPPYLNETSAITWIQSLNLDSYFSIGSHYPYLANDGFFGGKSLWGTSGSMAAGKAFCYKQPTGHGAVRGAHISPAGQKYGRIDRRGIEPKFNSGFATKIDLVANRIVWAEKGQYFGDCLTSWKRNNDLRFEHVTSTLLDIQKEFVVAAKIAQFEPGKAATDIMERLGKQICDRRVTAGALVEPRDPNWNGEAPYKIVVTELSMDLYEAKVVYANGGIARRISIQVEFTR